jgi:hypothetical protein
MYSLTNSAETRERASICMACISLVGAATLSEVRLLGLYQYISVLRTPKDDVSNVPDDTSAKTRAEVLGTLSVPAPIHRSSQRDCPRSLERACDVALREAGEGLLDPFRPPCTGPSYDWSGAHTPFRTVSQDAFCEVHAIPIDSLSLFSESPAILRLFGARRLSQQFNPFFPGPPKGAYPYIRGHSSSGLFLAHSAECGH